MLTGGCSDKDRSTEFVGYSATLAQRLPAPPSGQRHRVGGLGRACIGEGRARTRDAGGERGRRAAALTDVPVSLQLLQCRPLLPEAVLGGRGRGPGGARRQELLERAGGRAGGAAAAHPVHRRRRAAAQAALHLPQPPKGLQEARRLGAPRAARPRHPRDSGRHGSDTTPGQLAAPAVTSPPRDSGSGSAGRGAPPPQQQQQQQQHPPRSSRHDTGSRAGPAGSRKRRRAGPAAEGAGLGAGSRGDGRDEDAATRPPGAASALPPRFLGNRIGVVCAAFPVGSFRLLRVELHLDEAAHRLHLPHLRSLRFPRGVRTGKGHSLNLARWGGGAPHRRRDGRWTLLTERVTGGRVLASSFRQRSVFAFGSARRLGVWDDTPLRCRGDFPLLTPEAQPPAPAGPPGCCARREKVCLAIRLCMQPQRGSPFAFSHQGISPTLLRLLL